MIEDKKPQRFRLSDLVTCFRGHVFQGDFSAVSQWAQSGEPTSINIHTWIEGFWPKNLANPISYPSLAQCKPYPLKKCCVINVYVIMCISFLFLGH